MGFDTSQRIAPAQPGHSTLPGSAPRGRIPGNRGIWVGITCVFVEFSVLFTVYFVARAHFPDAFHAGAERLSRWAGTLITLLMISSSFCLAASVVTIRTGRQHSSLYWLIAGLLLALGYPVTKYFEISWNLAQGVDASAGVFVGAYYYLTLNHLVHASWGLLGMLWVLVRHIAGAYTAANHSGLEALASYWHATDIVWLAIFPLFYVLA
jgi:cytochrome c oxidase subunit 3